MVLKTYFDFAENDYGYFWHSFEQGIVANAMAADAQEICEKYMKHLIDQYFTPVTQEQQMEYDAAMRTHNLLKLARFLEDGMGLRLGPEMKKELRAINGYYFTACCPGDESIEVNREDIELCAHAVRLCREEVLRQIEGLENRTENKI